MSVTALIISKSRIVSRWVTLEVTDVGGGELVLEMVSLGAVV